VKEIDPRFDYELPEDRIARLPAARRDESRLMGVDPASGLVTDLGLFRSIADRLGPGDLLVLNDTRVFPARLRGRRRTGGAVEILLLEAAGARVRALVRPLTKIHLGEPIFFGPRHPRDEAPTEARLIEKTPEGPAVLDFSPLDAGAVAARFGEMPIPPYLKRAAEPIDAERYQTVYADRGASSAAPTAGLHFTPELLDLLRRRGVEVRSIRLDVGYATFAPVLPDQERLHFERYFITDEVRALLDRRLAGSLDRRIVAVGTTAVRALESYARTGCAEGETDLYIRPGHEFRIVDALITNFHLPGSSLLRLVHAFAGEIIFEAYGRAIEWGFRFYSYGDAMFVSGRYPHDRSGPDDAG
jgi:S-adenosylmethionine:tRNA ribosyltransferase-isomerase